MTTQETPESKRPSLLTMILAAVAILVLLPTLAYGVYTVTKQGDNAPTDLAPPVNVQEEPQGIVEEPNKTAEEPKAAVDQVVPPAEGLQPEQSAAKSVKSVHAGTSVKLAHPLFGSTTKKVVLIASVSILLIAIAAFSVFMVVRQSTQDAVMETIVEEEEVEKQSEQTEERTLIGGMSLTQIIITASATVIAVAIVSLILYAIMSRSTPKINVVYVDPNAEEESD